jgi:hypothetical protein
MHVFQDIMKKKPALLFEGEPSFFSMALCVVSRYATIADIYPLVYRTVGDRNCLRVGSYTYVKSGDIRHKNQEYVASKWPTAM